MEKDLGSRRNEVHSRTVKMRSISKEKGQMEQRTVQPDVGIKLLYFVCVFSLGVLGFVVVPTQVSMVQWLLNDMTDSNWDLVHKPTEQKEQAYAIFSWCKSGQSVLR